jgi:hypothetical protein
MKNLELKKIEQLLSIIPDHPALRIMYITDGNTQLTDALFKLIQNKEYELLLNVVTDDYEEIKEKYTHKEVTVKKITFEQRRYASMAKTYDYVFVSATVPETLQNQFAKTIHTHIKNAGNIILFLEKDNLKLLDSWRQVLEENYFVASNTIDLFDEYEVLSSKKMHGWGG